MWFQLLVMAEPVICTSPSTENNLESCTNYYKASYLKVSDCYEGREELGSKHQDKEGNPKR